MNPTLETIKKGHETFDSHMSATFLIADEKIVQSVLDRMKQWHTSFLISLFEGEVERLSKELKNNSVENIQCPSCGFYCLGKGGVYCIDKKSTHIEECAYNQGINDQIKHYQEIIDYLKSIV